MLRANRLPSGAGDDLAGDADSTGKDAGHSDARREILESHHVPLAGQIGGIGLAGPYASRAVGPTDPSLDGLIERAAVMRAPGPWRRSLRPDTAAAPRRAWRRHRSCSRRSSG